VCVYIKKEKRWKEFGEKKMKKKEKTVSDGDGETAIIVFVNLIN
jgi:hypothetical protein